jgi:hypothetical protein
MSQISDLEDLIRTMKKDEGLIKEGKLTELNAEGFAGKLFACVVDSRSLNYLWKEIYLMRYKRKGELDAHLNQRLTQIYQGFILGIWPSTAGTRIYSSLVGGTSHTSNEGIAGLAIMQLVLGLIGGAAQHLAVYAKNYRRSNEGVVTGWEQFTKGFWAVITGVRTAYTATPAANAANEMLATGRKLIDQLETLLQLQNYSKVPRRQIPDVGHSVVQNERRGRNRTISYEIPVVSFTNPRFLHD